MRRLENRPRGPRCFLLAALIVAAALLAYAPVLRAGFIWDDDAFLTENPLIRAPDGLYRAWFTTTSPDYFPLTSSMLWLEWRLWGPNAAGYHLVNVLLHAASAVLLWRVLLRLRIPGAWLAGLLFAVHPVAVESVAWITERKNTLAMALYLASILAWLRCDGVGFHHDDTTSTTNGSRQTAIRSDHDETTNTSNATPHSTLRTPHYLLSLGLFLLALLAKTSVVMLPAVLLGCAWWRRGRVARRDLVRVLPFAAVAAALGLVTIWYQYHNAIGPHVVRSEGLASRAVTAGWAAWFYLYKALLPLKLCFVYPRWTAAVSLLAVVPGLLFLAMLFLFARFGPKGWGRPFLFALGYFLVTLLPVLGFVDISFMYYSLVADRWQYTALVGVVALAAGLSARLQSGPAERGRRRRRPPVRWSWPAPHSPSGKRISTMTRKRSGAIPPRRTRRRGLRTPTWAACSSGRRWRPAQTRPRSSTRPDGAASRPFAYSTGPAPPSPITPQRTSIEATSAQPPNAAPRPSATIAGPSNSSPTTSSLTAIAATFT